MIWLSQVESDMLEFILSVSTLGIPLGVTHNQQIPLEISTLIRILSDNQYNLAPSTELIPMTLTLISSIQILRKRKYLMNFD